LTPRRNSPRETELRIFSELGQNLGKSRAEGFPLYPLLSAPSRQARAQRGRRSKNEVWGGGKRTLL